MSNIEMFNIVIAVVMIIRIFSLYKVITKKKKGSVWFELLVIAVAIIVCFYMNFKSLFK